MSETQETSIEIRAGWHRHPNGGGWVEDSAHVDTTARVYGNAWVYGDAWVSSVLYIQGSKHSLTTSSYSKITIGCESHTLEHWLENYSKIGEVYKYSESEIEEYADLIKFAVRWLEQKGYRKS